MDKTLDIDVAGKSIKCALDAWSKAQSVPVDDRVTLRLCVDEFSKTGVASLLRGYFERYPSTVYKSPVGLLAAVILSNVWHSPIHVCEHAKMRDLSAHNDQQYLLQCCLPPEIAQYGTPAVVKTVSILAKTESGNKSIVVTELGDVRLDDETLQRISNATGISMRALTKHSHLNSGDFRPIARLGLQPGHIGPFPHFVDEVDYFVFRQMDKPAYVAVRFTPDDIVCVDRRILQPLARAFLEKLGKKYIVIDAEDV